MTTFILLVAVYVAVLAWVSYRVSRDASSENYLIAGRKRNWWQVAASKYAASVGAGWFLTYTGFAYTFGWPLGLVILGGLVGILVYAYWAVPRLRSGSAFYTQSDFVRVRTSSTIASKYLDGSVALVAILSLLIAITGAATLLDTFGFLAYESAVVFTVAVVVAYIVFAGYRAVMTTDVLQGLLILVLTLVVSVFVVMGAPPSYETVVEMRDISTLGIIILMFFGFVSVFADPTRYQVSYAGQSAETVKKAMVATLGPLIVTAVAIFFVASAVYEGNPGLEAAAVFPVALTEYLPATLIPVGFFVFLVALMSTADSYLYALALHSVTLCTGRAPTRALIRWHILGYGVLLTIAALLYRDVVGLAVLTGAILIIVAVPMLHVINGGRDPLRFVLLLSGGYVGALVGILTLGLIPDAGAFVLMGCLVGALVPTKLLRS